MNARPLGVGSVTEMFVAVVLLVLLIASWNVTFELGAAVGKPLFTMSRSTTPPVATGVLDVDELFALLPSFVELLTDAVLTMVLPLWLGGTKNVAVMVFVWPEVSVPSE